MPRTGVFTSWNIFRPLTRIGHRDILRGGHDHRARNRDFLHERQLHIAGAGGQIDDQVIELSPIDIVEELVDQLGDQRATPDQRLFRIENEADAHQLHAVALERHDLVVRASAACRCVPNISGILGP